HADPHDDVAAFCKLNGIIHEVSHDLPQTERVSLKLGWNGRGHRTHQLDAFALRSFQEEDNHILERSPRLESNTFQFHLPGFDLGEIQEIVDNLEQAAP